MRVLITGSRTWTDEKYIRDRFEWFDALVVNEKVILVHGACPRGADAIADKIAQEYGWTVERHPADWIKYGKRAGYIRNAEMVKLGADVCYAFIKDNSPGATMCANFAEKAGIPTERICR